MPFVLVTLLAAASPLRAQITISGPDDVNFRFGVLGQFQADTTDIGGTEDTNNLFIRRFRLMFSGQVAKNVTFFVETDAPNLGRELPAGKNIAPGVILQDAFGDFKVSDAFILEAGLMFIPFSYNSLQSAATLLPIDYGPFTFNQSAVTQSSTGRDTGFQARGYLDHNRVEYRIGVFQGFRNAVSGNPFRYAGRVMYSFFDPEVGFFYAGTFFGKKKVLEVGGAFDAQEDYRGYDADAFTEIPVGNGAVTAQVDYNHFDGHGTFKTLPKQDNVLAEAGYFFRPWKLEPVVQFSHNDIVDASGSSTRFSLGANFWWAGHNANIKGAYTHATINNAHNQNEFTIQFQLFYY